ncbi:MAG: protein TolR [Rickettsiaceae bacterium]|nr:MAG: protein TolR [Rickettsiaceae bacterium]
MAINLGNNVSSRRRRTNLSSEINVTPLVDVMLVLLIIFMVTSPMLISGIVVDLPETKSSPVAGQDEPLTVTIDKDSNIYIHETKIEYAELAQKLSAITKEKKDSRIFVRGDKNIAYGEIMKIMTEIHSAGYTKVALVSNTKYDEKK